MTNTITTSVETARAKTPWHLWAVGAVTLAWNGFSAFDYLMTQTRNAAYMANFSAEQRDYFQAFPTWVEATWALGVWGAVAGSVLLLLRSRFAVWAFAVSLVGLLGTTVWQYGMGNLPDSLTGPGYTIFAVVIWAVAIALFLYARRMQARGLLH